MYAVLNPDGTLHELRDGEIQPTTNTANRLKRYAVPVSDTRPARTDLQRRVNERRVVTADLVTLGADGVEIIPIPTDADKAESFMTSDAFARGLIKVLANRFSVTPQQLIDAIKARADP
jgi:hypothetical protein